MDRKMKRIVSLPADWSMGINALLGVLRINILETSEDNE